jgi:hypothetical protein
MGVVIIIITTTIIITTKESSAVLFVIVSALYCGFDLGSTGFTTDANNIIFSSKQPCTITIPV